MKPAQINILLFSALLLALSSCLKKDAMNIDPDTGTKNVVEFANTGDNVASASSVYPRFFIDLGTITANQVVPLQVNVSYSGNETAPQDITVSLGIDSIALKAYDTTFQAEYIVPPASVYKLPSSVVIKKGTRQTSLQIPITISSDFDFNDSYALPLKIVSASHGVISHNFGTAFYSFGGRNKYDGIYVMKGYVNHPTAAYVGPFKAPEVTFTTIGASSIAMEAQPFFNNGALSFFGVYPVFTVNADNSVTVTNLPDGGKAPSVSDPTYKNRYDPATKTFYISYSYNATTPRIIYDTCTWVQAR
jgi:hypothetical protein